MLIPISSAGATAITTVDRPEDVRPGTTQAAVMALSSWMLGSPAPQVIRDANAQVVASNPADLGVLNPNAPPPPAIQPPPPLLPSVIFEQVVTGGIGGDAAQIQCTVDRTCELTVLYGQTTTYGSSAGPVDASPDTQVNINIMPLVTNTTYHFAVFAHVLDGSATDGVSLDQKFVTPN